VGFAGARVIKQTIGADLPEGFQKAEFLLEHGLIDAIVERSDMKKYLSDTLKFFCGK
ncbi:acetyl-CoA carboxylase carboxyl transferase subunit beta, partial [Campylobacter coli]|nr:acetyl-CoA carboxylase carboxyl transferase subunit beta [Campylobacter coli]